jgi:tetratricopeptide (TPR) repeat protein
MRTILARAVVPLLLSLFTLSLAEDVAEAKKKLTRAEKKAARQAFKKGRIHLRKKRFVEAIEQFKKAYEITQDGLVMGQVAIAFEKAGDCKRALEAIRVYRKSLPKSDRGSADQMIKRYEKRIAAGKTTDIRLPSDPPPPKPKPEPKPEPTKVVKKEPPKAKPVVKPKRRKRFWTWVALGSAGALAVSAIVVGLSAQSKYDELKDDCAPYCANSEVDSVRARAVATDVLIGTAIAAGVTAGVLFFLEGRGASESSSPSPSKQPDIKEDDLGEDNDDLVKSFRITPVVGAKTYGIGAEIRY